MWSDPTTCVRGILTVWIDLRAFDESKLPLFPYGDGLRPHSRGCGGGLYAVPIVRIPYERWDDRDLTLAHICPLRWVQAVEWKPGWSGAWNSRSLKTWRASWTNLIDWADADGRPDPPRHPPSTNSGFSVTLKIVGAQISKLQRKSRANRLGCSFFFSSLFSKLVPLASFRCFISTRFRYGFAGGNM